MATTFYLRDLSALTQGSGVSDQANLTELFLSTSRGASVATSVTNTVSGPTAIIPITATAGGTTLSWFTDPLASFSLTGTTTVNLWASENNSSANATVGAELYITDSNGLNPTLWASGLFGTTGTELTTTPGAKNFTLSGTTTSVTTGQRLKLVVYIDDATGVNMANTWTVSVTYNGGTGAASGDSYLTITPTVTPVALAAVSTAVAGAYAPTVRAGLELDTTSESHTGTSGSTSQASFSWSHAGATSNVKGILVFVYNTGPTSLGSVDYSGSISVTYGGVSLTRVTLPGNKVYAVDTANEFGSVYAYFLGTNVPQGTQTVVVNRPNNTAEFYATASTIDSTVVYDTEINTAGIVLLEEDGSLTEQNVDDGATIGSSIRFAAAYSGLNSPPTAGANSTLAQSIALGSGTTQRSCVLAVETVPGLGTQPVGFSGASDDRAAVHLAVRMIPSVTVTVGNSGSSVASAVAPSKKVSLSSTNAASTTANVINQNVTLKFNSVVTTATAIKTTDQVARASLITLSTADANANSVIQSFKLLINSIITSATTDAYAPTKPSITTSNVAESSAGVYTPAKSSINTSTAAGASADVYAPVRASSITFINADAVANILLQTTSGTVYPPRTSATAEVYSPPIQFYVMWAAFVAPESGVNSVLAETSNASAEVFAPSISTQIYAETANATADAFASSIIISLSSSSANAYASNDSPALFNSINIFVAGASAAIDAATTSSVILSYCAQSSADAYAPTKPSINTSSVAGASAVAYAPTKPSINTSTAAEASADAYSLTTIIRVNTTTSDSSATTSLLAIGATVYVDTANSFAESYGTLGNIQIFASVTYALAEGYSPLAFYNQILNAESSFEANIITKASQNINFAIQSLFGINQTNTITRSLANVGQLATNFVSAAGKKMGILWENFFFDNSINGGNSSTVNFDDILNAETGNSSIDGSPVPASKIQKYIDKKVAAPTNLFTFLVNPFTKFVQLSLTFNTLFETAFKTTVLSSAALANSYLPYFTKNITFNIEELINLFNVSIDSKLSLFRTLSIPYVIDAGDESTQGSLLDGGDESSVYTETYDGMNEYGGFIVPSTRKEVGSSLLSAVLTNINFVRTIDSRLSATLSTSLHVLSQIVKSINTQNIFNTVLNITVTNGSNAFEVFLTVVMNSTDSIKNLTYSYMNRTTSLTAASTSSVGKYLNAVSTLSSQINNLVFRYITLSLMELFQSNTTKQVLVDKPLSYTLDTNKIKSLTKTINYAAAFTSLIFTQTLNFVSISLNSAYSVNYQKLINKYSNISLSFLSNIFNVAARYVTLSIFNSFESSFNKTINTVQQLSITLILNLEKNITKIISLVSSWLTLLNINQLISRTLNVQSTLNVDYKKIINQFINATLTLSSNIFNAAAHFITISIFNSFESSFNKIINVTKASVFGSASNLTKGTLKTIGASFSLTTLFVTNSSLFRTLVASTTFATSYQKSITKFINAISNLFVEISSVAARFITISILNLFETSAIKQIDSTNQVSSGFNTSFTKAIAKNISYLTSFISLILTQSLNFITLSINELFDSYYAKIVNYNLNATSSLSSYIRFIINKTINIVDNFNSFLSKTTLFSLNAQSTVNALFDKAINRFDYVSTNLTTAFTNQIFKFVNSSLTFLTTVQTISYRSVTLAINILFDSININKIDKYLISSSSLTINIKSQIDKYLSVAEGFGTMIFTQSSRFVNFAVTSLLDSSITKALTNLISQAATLDPALRGLINKYLSFNSASTLATEKDLKINLPAYNNFGPNFNKTINFALAITRTFETALSQTIFRFKILAVNLTNNIKLNLLMSNGMRLELINAFDAAIVKNVKTTIEVSSIVYAQTIKLVNNLINAVFNTSLLVLPLSLRYVTFEIMSAFAANTQKQAFYVFNTANQFATVVTKKIYHLIDGSVNFNQVFKKSIENTLEQVSSSFNSSFAKNIFTSLFVDVIDNLKIKRQVFTNLITDNLFNSNLFSTSSRNITLAISNLFDTTVRKIVSTNILATYENLSNINRAIQLTISATAGIVSLILTQSLRFVNFAMLSSFEVSSNSDIEKFTNISLNSISSTYKSIYLGLTQSLSIFIDMFYEAGKTRLLVIAQDFQTGITKNIKTEIDRIVTAFVSIKTYNFKQLIISLDLMPNLLTILRRIISLSINNLFDPYRANETDKRIELDANVQFDLSKVISWYRNITQSLNANIFTQQLRFVYMSLVDLMTVENFKFNINKFIKINNDLTVKIVKSVLNLQFANADLNTVIKSNIQKFFIFNNNFDVSSFIAINAFLTSSLEATINLKRSFSHMLDLATTYSTNVIKQITSTIEIISNYATVSFKNFFKTFSVGSTLTSQIKNNLNKFVTISMSNTLSLLTQSARFISFQINELFDNSFRIQVAKTFNLNVLFGNIIQRSITTNIELLADFVGTAVKQSRRLIGVSLSISVAATKQTFIRLSSVLNLDSSFIDLRSFRALTLSILSNFDTRRTLKVGARFNASFSVVTTISFGRRLTQVLQVVLTLPVRRSHTLLSSMITFAVNKSKPGSEGSAQKRTTKNNSSTLFKRGKTDDLD